MSGLDIQIPYKGMALPGYMAEPMDGQKPGVVVIGAIFGVDDDIKAITNRLAANGYPAIAPNMFWEDADDTGVLPVSPEGSERGRARAARVNRDAGVAYIAAAIEVLRASPRCNEKIAVQGYCFGGPFMVQASARLGVSAGFSYHGSYVEKFLSEFGQVTCPVQFHYGDNDAVAPMEGSVSAVQAACVNRDAAEVFVYAGGEHSYMFPSRAGVYLEDAAELSWRRTFELLANL
ncbi:MAG: dienelactone hydrolase family protein [Rhodospirillales bacterium]|nr:dienelactone hydrolase family protein [Rhodospirillales bacterium]